MSDSMEDREFVASQVMRLWNTKYLPQTVSGQADLAQELLLMTRAEAIARIDRILEGRVN